MATESEIVNLANDYEAAIKERDRVQKLVASVGDKQSALAQQLVALNKQVADLRRDLKNAL